jgi:uncharacterized membrane protein
MNDESLVTNQPQGAGMAKLVYILYLVGIMSAIPSLAGIVVAYVYQPDAPNWLKSHYQFQIRTFWIGLVFAIAGLALTTIYIGFLVLLFWVIWLTIRCVKGFKLAEDLTPIPNPKTWLF